MNRNANGVVGPSRDHHGAADGQVRVTTRRALRPRASIAVAAVYISQLNCAQTIGVNDRRFLDELVPRCRGEVTKLGKLRLIPLEVAVAALRAMALSDDGAEQHAVRDDSGEPATVEAVLSQIGKEIAT